MKRKSAVWIAAGGVASIILAALSLLPRADKGIDTPPEDFRTRLSSTGSMTIGWEDKEITITGDDKQALVALLNSLAIEPILNRPEPTHAPGHLFSIESKSQDGTKEASIFIQGMQWIREYRGDKLIDYILPEQEYQTLCGVLDELFQSKYKPDA